MLEHFLEEGRRKVTLDDLEERALVSSQVGQTTYFCTMPLNDGGDWQPVPHCRLIAYRDGQMVRVAAAHNYFFDDDGYLRRYGIEASG